MTVLNALHYGWFLEMDSRSPRVRWAGPACAALYLAAYADDAYLDCCSDRAQLHLDLSSRERSSLYALFSGLLGSHDFLHGQPLEFSTVRAYTSCATDAMGKA